ncbi:TAXI family TRAP transporter solute-binding subunit [Ramlibacter sp. USB13]|uniref:TAXI family TRAP transporter solute-binding subunit n=1 Tax=Ramlibacter cellulosilyticus TaxID=2764187 RepID=A0A923MNX1_9BURK|nr:TAXI family TRAP transporter solute-binding subunit [Ramlibacter cellulosilyticus]MBC5782505.1 TAXI family TRAP transporter solute-binding subunit [Ramlibacter cellulosilyticus]
MHRLLMLLSVVLLAACSGGPDADALRRDVEARLAHALPGGTLMLEDLARRGSQRDATAPPGESRRVVYYDARLRVARDTDFGAWDAPGMAGLVSALGAGPKGVSGIHAGGNKAGDTVQAHGTAIYRREGDTWVAVGGGGFRPAQAPAYATNAAAGPAAMLEEMRKVIEAIPKETAPAQMAIVQEELMAAQAAIRARLARAGSGYAIAAGPEHGQYLRFARALAAQGGVRILPLVTLGGEENLDLLREGRVQLAMAQADAALAAYEGSGVFQQRGPAPALRAIGSLYPEPVHVLARADARFATAADLRGRKVAIGPPGAASRTTALRVLEAHGLGARDYQPVDLGLADALVALRRGEVDAVLQVIGVPADSIREAVADVRLKLLPLSDRAIQQLAAARRGLFPYTIAAGSYSAQPRGVRTVATAALLLAGADLSEAEVTNLARAVFQEGRDYAAAGSAQGLQVSAATARQQLTVPLHAAAARALVPASAAASAASAPR